MICEITFGTPEYDEAVALRYLVLRAPLGLDYTPEQLAEEWNQIHLAAFDDQSGKMIGYLNLTPVDEKQVKMRQVAVDPAYQGQGVGAALVAASEQVAQTLHFSKITLHARQTAVPFYLKLRYTVEGDVFEEVTIPHFKMWKAIGS